MQTRRLRFGKKLAFCLVTCGTFFLVVELGMRTANGWSLDWLDCHRPHETLGWSLREGWRGDWRWTGGESQINAQGIRDDEPVGAKSPGEKRLLILGDSVTFGAKVRTDQTYPHQLELALKRRGELWRVLNGGVTAYDPSQEADWLELFGWNLEPDLLAVAFCRNDTGVSVRTGRTTRQPANEFGQWLTEQSIVAYKFQRSAWKAAAKLGGMSATRKAEGKSRGWKLIEESYRRIAASAKQKEVSVVLVVFPTLHGVQGVATDDYSERLQKLGRDLGWTVVDLHGAFTADAESLFLPDDPVHPSALGYERAGRSLASWFVTNQPCGFAEVAHTSVAH